MTLFGGSPFYKGQKIAPLYMQSLVPRAIAIIEFGAEGDNCAVAKYKTTKMADKQSIPRCSYPEVLFPVPEQFQGQNLRENSPPCIGVFLCTLWIDWPRSPPQEISTTSDFYGHFLGLFVADSDAKDAFIRVNTRAKPYYRVSRQSDSNPIPQKLTLLGG